ncbi:MAG: (2Fe-2S)-binding protein [Bryobacterales bacterium]|nr:(2Fe-2S)-binding protein [Bryobacterales bacterium]
MKTTFRFAVNGRARIIKTEGDRPLLEVLREDLGLTGTKYGCGEGQCRACTVLLDGKAVTSCLTPVSAAAGKKVVTIEGLATDGKLHPVQEAFAAEGAIQCGYCVPGMILTTAALLEKNARPTDRQIVDALNGNLCRCSGYPRILVAVRRAVEMRGAADAGQD